jgi:hypothetical protein
MNTGATVIAFVTVIDLIVTMIGIGRVWVAGTVSVVAGL